MTAKGKWVRRSADEQRAMVAKFVASGLGAAAFCRREAISTASLYRWQGLRGKSSEARPHRADEQSPAFVDLGALRLPVPSIRRVEVKLELGDGLVLHLVRG